ncbi:hypothetical protein QGM71_05135 [Virgibacillus sp. C22-A2]|uniref:Nucleotide kinase n=1 Tax=Virgibacillus tibetensis TaxID=3042313 RepID=A0ABU6KCT2_9BACI|nr:hypothetical protein [Virgibacillus sp. C22-A2]
MPSKKYYYVTGNTAEGFINLLPTNLEGIHQIIVLNHPSHTIKTTILKEIIKTCESDYTIEILLSALDDKYLDGVIIRSKSIAIITDEIDLPELYGALELDLSLFIKERSPDNKNRNKVREDVVEFTEAAYNNFKSGLKIHDNLESIYIKEMDFQKADRITAEFIEELLHSVQKKDRKSHVRHRMFGTNTARGIVNVVPQLIKSTSKAYFIKGRAGTGKSTFMKKIKDACEYLGFDVDLYYCSFDPNSIDMVLVPELDFCIFDSTDPHEFYPERAEDIIIDLYEETVTPGTDEKYNKEISELNNNYKSYMRKGLENLKTAGEHLETIELTYTINKEETADIVDFIIKSFLSEQ